MFSFLKTNSTCRLEREKRTIAVMIAMYHRGIHAPDPLCSDCTSLLEYTP